MAGSPALQELHPRASELFALLGTGNLTRKAKSEGLSVSALCEREDRSDPKEIRQGSDAFSRLFQIAEITTESDESFGTYFADRLDAFDRDANTKALFPEWVARQWRKVNGIPVMGGPGIVRSNLSRAVPEFFSADQVAGSILTPYTDAPDLRQKQIAPAIPLSEIVSRTTMIDTADYRALYLTEPSTDAVRMFRVSEGAGIPRSRIGFNTHIIHLRKFGRAVESTYETLRRVRIDQIAEWIRRVAIQNVVDQVAAAMDVAVNGDGNANSSATSYNLTTLDSGATPGTLTAKGWLAFRMLFINPYVMTTALAQSGVALQLEMLNLGNNYLTLYSQPQLGSPIVPINQQLSGGIRLGVTADAPANTVIGFDSRFSIERVVEANSVINEAERWIERQVEVLTFTENEAYAVYDANATKLLAVNA